MYLPTCTLVNSFIKCALKSTYPNIQLPSFTWLQSHGPCLESWTQLLFIHMCSIIQVVVQATSCRVQNFLHQGADFDLAPSLHLQTCYIHSQSNSVELFPLSEKFLMFLNTCDEHTLAIAVLQGLSCSLSSAWMGMCLNEEVWWTGIMKNWGRRKLWDVSTTTHILSEKK